jgi:hypothetical protein
METAWLYNVRFWAESCNTPPSSVSEDRLDVIVLGRDRLGTESAPTKFGVFDAGLLAGDEHWLAAPIESATVTHDALDCSVVDDGNRLAKVLASPGIQLPIELRTVRMIMDETSITLTV